MGYAFNDNRASGGKLVEIDTVQCPHCQAQLAKPNRQTVHGAWCMKCSKHVCDRPPCNTRCEPFFRALEKALSRQSMLSSIGL